MLNFSFICRESKTDKKGLSAIELSVNINGERVYIALPLKVKPSEFKKMMSAKKNNEVLEYTSNVRTKLNKYINEMMSKDIPITAYTIKEYFKTGGTRSYTISQLVTEFLIYYKAKTSNCSSYVIRKYELASEEISEEIFDDAIDYNSSFNIFIKVLEYEIGVEGNTSFEDGAQHFELYDNENEFEFIIASIEEFSRLSSNFYDLLDDLNIVKPLKIVH